MYKYKEVDSALGPEELGAIYRGTEHILERSHRPSEKNKFEKNKIAEVEDLVVKKVYGNLESTLRKISSSEKEVKPASEEEDVTSQINSYRFKDENDHFLDKSVKGSVDVLLNPILRIINQERKYKTTSCCSGRIIFFEKDEYFQNKKSKIFGRSGRILYSSHSHISQRALEEALECINSNPKSKFECYKNNVEEDEEETKDCSNTPCSEEVVDTTENEVVLKFEPFLIHVDCRTIEEAADLINICKYAGLKQSGIITCNKKIVLAIRGNKVLEAPVMIKRYHIEKDKPFLIENEYLVTREYLIHLINTCNSKLTDNFYQFLRLYHKLKRSFRVNEVKVCEQHDNLKVSGELEHHEQVKEEGEDKEEEGVVNERKTGEAQEKYIDIIKKSKKIKECKMSFPLGEREVTIRSFGENPNYLLRYNCCMGSSRDFVVLFGGYEKSKTRTMCVCDLLEVERGFRVVDVGEKGPECVIDSSIVSDGRVFIVFGGRKNAKDMSNEAHLLYVYRENREIETTWAKCQLEGTEVPEKRFRHAICLENTTHQEGKTEEATITRFYLSGGITLSEGQATNNLGDLWICTVKYKICRNHIHTPRINWKCIYDKPSFAWSSGSLVYDTCDNSLRLIGGCQTLDQLLDISSRKEDEIIKLDLKTNKLYKEKYRNLNKEKDDQTQKETLKDKKYEDETKKIQYQNLSENILHCTLKLTNEDYLVVGGLGKSHYVDEVWYLNTTRREWKKVMDLPKGTRSSFGCCLVVFETIKCKHMEIWMLGGGMPLMFIYGSIYDDPIRIILKCSGICEQDCAKEEPPQNKKTKNQSGMYIIVENRSLVKEFKNLCERKKVFDNKRKIIKYQMTKGTIVHKVECKSNQNWVECSRCKNNICCQCCNCCCNCITQNVNFNKLVFLIPVIHFKDKALELDSLFKVYLKEPQDQRVEYRQDPKTKLVSMIESEEIKEKVNKVEILGDSLLIRVEGEEEDLGELRGELISKEFGVNSVAIVGEIEGVERKRRTKVIQGKGDVVVKENGVAYHFNLKTNMFSKGNSLERIRILRDYFCETLPEEPVSGSGRKPETVVDLFCGIGYFSIPLLKFTDERRIRKVLCIDINEEAIKFLKINGRENKIDEGRMESKVEDCRNFGVTFGREYVDTTDRVLLGLLPSSEVGWTAALKAINKREGGMLHIHGLTMKKDRLKFEEIRTDEAWKEEIQGIRYTEEQYNEDKRRGTTQEYFTIYTLKTFYEMSKNMPFMKNSEWILHIAKVQNVKHYSPHKYHQVVDLVLKPIF